MQVQPHRQWKQLGNRKQIREEQLKFKTQCGLSVDIIIRVHNYGECFINS